MDCCTHETFQVPMEYGNDFEVPVIVHRPKRLSGTSGAIIYAHGGGAIAGKAEDFKPHCSDLAVRLRIS